MKHFITVFVLTGLMVLAGPSGCGETEITEHFIISKKFLDKSGMVTSVEGIDLSGQLDQCASNNKAACAQLAQTLGGMIPGELQQPCSGKDNKAACLVLAGAMAKIDFQRQQQACTGGNADACLLLAEVLGDEDLQEEQEACAGKNAANKNKDAGNDSRNRDTGSGENDRNKKDVCLPLAKALGKTDFRKLQEACTGNNGYACLPQARALKLVFDRQQPDCTGKDKGACLQQAKALEQMFLRKQLDACAVNDKAEYEDKDACLLLAKALGDKDLRAQRAACYGIGAYACLPLVEELGKVVLRKQQEACAGNDAYACLLLAKSLGEMDLVKQQKACDGNDENACVLLAKARGAMDPDEQKQACAGGNADACLLLAKAYDTGDYFNTGKPPKPEGGPAAGPGPEAGPGPAAEPGVKPESGSASDSGGVISFELNPEPGQQGIKVQAEDRDDGGEEAAAGEAPAAAGGGPGGGKAGPAGRHPDEDRRHIRQDKEEAVKFYKKACDLNKAESCMELGSKYTLGMWMKEIKEDNKKQKAEKEQQEPFVPFNEGMKYLEKACSLDDAGGCVMAGKFYEIGRNIPADFVKASEAYKKACDQLHYGPGCLYMANLDVEETYRDNAGPGRSMQEYNFDAAIGYYDKGCKLGDKKSCQNYKIFNNLKKLKKN